MRSVVLVLLLALAGCASTEVQKPAPLAYAAATVQAQALASGHAALSGQARRDNADAIERLLAQLDDATLARDAARLPAGDPLYNFAGRALQRRGLPLPHAFDRGDASFGAADRPAADRDGYRPPLKVGVLLPLSGAQAAAAAAVRDGYLAGYYGETRRRPALRFYDTAAGAKPALARAAADGNDFVVGPLAREEADALFAAGEPPVPMLALNRGSRTPPSGSAAFSLSPEDEGISLAQHLIDERHRKRVLLIAGGEDTQRRTADAARAQLESRGVKIVARLGVSEQMTDALRQLAQTDAPDAVLLVLKGPQARSVAPQLAAAGLGGVDRLASSQIVSGTGKPAEDMALDGIVFPTEPWLIQRVDGLPPQASAAARVNTAKGPAARLFAFGFDAWRLTAHLEQLALAPNASIAGATGRLSLDGFGNVLRRPGWSRFAGGEPVPLADGAR
ncbi:penicillin-binding protein activator [Thermomonas brevis]|uniref:Penicillin-binding protein activator n=1 Tax=Thermomonas brevis TaxID=215691 RepID=A0A7G9QQN4_9GAMM|nr:penicillin-binding protein activator [Thermomonas brevis]QNN45659.1 penicillin-binding protein activator [Thermomonas brevis]